MQKDEALQILKIGDSELNESTVLKAFNRMVNRYPQIHFPQKYQSFVQAKQILIQGADFTEFRRYFFDDNLDLSWLNRFRKNESSQSSLSVEGRELALWLKPYLGDSSGSFLSDDDDDDSFDLDFDENMMEEIFRMLGGKKGR